MTELQSKTKRKVANRAPIAPSAPAESRARTLSMQHVPGKTLDRQLTDLVAQGVAVNASMTMRFVQWEYGADLSLTDMVASLREHGEAVNRGDLSAPERMLNAQAVTLNAIFAELARRAALNMGEHLDATDRYMRLALKAQSQSRATFETLAAIKNPPVVFARQANINNGGQQQVNNGTASMPEQPSRAPESVIEPNKLLGATNGERLDVGTKGKASRAHPRVATVGAINRPKHRCR